MKEGPQTKEEPRAILAIVILSVKANNARAFTPALKSALNNRVAKLVFR